MDKEPVEKMEDDEEYDDDDDDEFIAVDTSHLSPPVRTVMDNNQEKWVSWYHHGPLFKEKYIHLIPHYVYPDGEEYRAVRVSVPLLVQCDIYLLIIQEVVDYTDVAKLIDHPAMRIFIDILDQSPLFQSYNSGCLCTKSGIILISIVGSRLDKYQHLCATFPQLTPALNILQLTYLICNASQAIICQVMDQQKKKIAK